MFQFQADVYFQALARFDPAILAATRNAMGKALTDGTCIYPNAVAFPASSDN